MESIDQYVIQEELARGNMGVVYRAHDPKLGRDVALKVMLNTELAGAAELTRFRTEAQVTARLRHPNIVPILGAGVSNGRPYLAMELVKGESLAARLKRLGKLPPAESARIAERLASALGCAHGQGIVHRDVKPHNVLIDERGEPQLTDFGIAKVLGAGEGLTVTGEMLGTPSYMAPEAAHGDKDQIGPATDVYSLGVTLFHMLTGDVPFRGTSMLEVLDRVVTSPTVRVRERAPEVDPDLDAICADAMAKAIDDRIPDGEAFAARLVAWTSAQAAPPARSSRPIAILCGLVGVALGAALVLGREIVRSPASPPSAPADPAANADRDVALALIDEARRLAEGAQPRVALRLLTLAERYAPREPALHATRGFAIFQRDGNRAGDVLNEHLSKAQALDPNCAAALLREARRKGTPLPRVLRLMAQAVEREPTWAWLHVARSVYLKAVEDPVEAERGELASLTRAIDLNPRFVLAYLARARLHEAKGRPREVIRDAQQVLQLDPQTFVAYRMLGAARLHKRIDQPEQALLDYRHAAQIAPTLRTKARAFLAIGVIHGRALKTIKTDERRKFTRELALKEIDLALIADPSFDRAYFVRGTILESAGDYVGAINALNGALERVDPQSENATKYREIRQRVLTKLSKTKAR